MLKVLILVGVIVVGTSFGVTGHDASSVESSKNHMKALGAAQIGPSFRKKRENERHRRQDSEAEEDNLLMDAQKNVEKTGEELQQVLQMHEEAMKKLVEESHKKTEHTETAGSSKNINLDMKSIISNSIDEDEQKDENESNSEDESKESSNEKIIALSSQSEGKETEESQSISSQMNEEMSETDEKEITNESNVTEESLKTETKTDEETKEEMSSQLTMKNEKGEIPLALSSLQLDTSNNLKNLMRESSEVAQELQNVFKVLHDREAKLMEEVIRLKEALTGAVAIVSTKSRSGTSEAIRRCRKRMTRRSGRSTKDDPYKACVYIEPSAAEYSMRTAGASSSAEKHRSLTSENSEEIYPPEPSVRVYFPDETSDTHQRSSKVTSEEHSESIHEEGESENENEIISQEEEEIEEDHKKKLSHSSSSSDGDVDFDKVYWLKLPSTEEGEDEKNMEEKVEEVIEEVKEDGKDALIIPVARGGGVHHNHSHTHPGGEDSSKGFLTAINPNPALKNKLRRHIRRSIHSNAKKARRNMKMKRNANIDTKQHKSAHSVKA